MLVYFQNSISSRACLSFHELQRLRILVGRNYVKKTMTSNKFIRCTTFEKQKEQFLNYSNLFKQYFTIIWIIPKSCAWVEEYLEFV